MKNRLGLANHTNNFVFLLLGLARYLGFLAACEDLVHPLLVAHHGFHGLERLVAEVAGCWFLIYKLFFLMGCMNFELTTLS